MHMHRIHGIRRLRAVYMHGAATRSDIYCASSSSVNHYTTKYSEYDIPWCNSTSTVVILLYCTLEFSVGFYCGMRSCSSRLKDVLSVRTVALALVMALN